MHALVEVGMANSLESWHIDDKMGFGLVVAACAMGVRAILSAFKAWAIGAGEHLDDVQSGAAPAGAWRRRFAIAFRGFGADRNINDYWLPAIIGCSELAAFPVLISIDRLEVVGAWIALKTAGQWNLWGRSRTAFNRFLVGNLLVVGMAFGLLRSYVVVPH